MVNPIFTELEDKFFISLKDREDALFSIPAKDLLDQDQMERFLQFYAKCIKATDLTAAAAYFCSWLGFVALAQQYMLSLQNKKIDVSLANLVIQLYAKNQYYAFSFKICRWTESPLPENESIRAKELHQILADLYRGTIRPLIEAASVAAKIHIGQLWGQLPTRFVYYKNRMLDSVDDEVLQTRISDDLHVLRHDLDPHLFGRQKNPFHIEYKMVEDVYDSQRQVPVKSACCLYYKTEGGDYCYTCPRLKEEERSVRREKMREKLV